MDENDNTSNFPVKLNPENVQEWQFPRLGETKAIFYIATFIKTRDQKKIFKKIII